MPTDYRNQPRGNGGGGGFLGFLNKGNPLNFTKKIDPAYYVSQQSKPSWGKYGAMATLLAGGGLAASPYFAGGGGVYAGSASTVNPFAANLGSGGAWAPVADGSADGFYGPAGNWTAGVPGGDFGTLGAGSTLGVGTTGGQPWYNTYGGQTLINTGANLLGGLLQNRAISKAQKQQQADIENRIRQALAALSPEHIMALAQQFLPQMAANASTAGQTAIQAVREQAARTGQLEGPRALSFEAGTRAKLASDVQQRAFESAFNTAGGQASAITGAPYTPIQPQTGIADAITNSINQAYLVKALQQRPPQQTPYRWPYQPGIPYQWGG